MKTKNSRLGRLVPLLFTLSLASLHATVSVIGVDATAGPNWRTGATLEEDHEYGTLGYVVFGLNDIDGQYRNNYNIGMANSANAYNLPAGVAVSTTNTGINMWSGSTAGNFGFIQDPGNGNASTPTSLLANYGTNPKNFTITRATSAAYRLTLITASGDNAGATYSPSVNDGTGAVSTSHKHTVNGVVYHVFQISEGTSNIVIGITSTPNWSLTGIAFDAFVPPVPLGWVGATSAWDTTTTGNWTNLATSSPAVFANSPAHSVLFDDSAISTTVDIAPADVTPAGVEFNHSAKNFTLQGSHALAGPTGLTKAGSGTLTILNTNTYTGTTTIHEGTLTVGGAGSLGGGTHAGTISNNGTVAFESSANQTFSGVISGTGALTQNSTGMLTLAGPNTYTGLTTINGGTLRFSATGTTPATNSIVVNNTGVLTFARNDTWGQANTLRSAAIMVNSGGTLASGGFFNTLWNVTLNDGTLLANGGVNGTYPAFQLGGTLTVTGSSQFEVGLGANSMVNVGAQGNAVLTLSTPAATDALTVNTVLQNSQVTGASQAGAILKTGLGTLTLAAANTYTGATTVTGGTLNLTGSLGSSVNAVTIQDTATLTATGTINRPVTIASGGTLVPAGNAIDTLVIGNTLTLGGKVVCQIDKTGGTLTQDLLDTAAVVYGGTLEVVATGEPLALGDSFKLFNASGYYGGAFAGTSLPTLPPGLNWNLSGLTVDGTLTVVDTAAPPVFNPAAGGYVGGQAVTISSAPGTVIHYTVDGSDPKTSVTVVSGTSPLVANIPTDTESLTLTAYASQTGYGNSANVSATYATITTPAWNVDDNGPWSDATKWKFGVIPDGVGVPVDFSTFPQSVDATVTLDSNRTVGSLGFGNSNPIAWNLAAAAGSVLTLATTSGPPVIAVSGEPATLSPALAGTQGLTKSGTGTLRLLSGASSFTGDVTISAGAVLTTASTGGPAPVTSSLGNPSVARTITIANGATLGFGANDTFGNHTATVNVALAINGTVTNTGNWYNPLGALTFNGGTLHATGGANANFPAFALKGPVTVLGDTVATISGSGTNATYQLGGHLVTGTTFDVQGTAVLDLSGILGNGRTQSYAEQASFLTKHGTGTLTLGGSNTYTGNTTVTNGTLVLADNARLRFVIGATSGINNQLAGAGTVVLDGDFAIDTTAAAALAAGTWLLEDVPALAGAYGTTFSVVNPDGSPWTDAGGDKWTKDAGAGKLWTFHETTGTLTLGAAGGYETWALENNVTGGPNGDSDTDGIPNLVEYALNLNPAGSDGSAGIFNGSLLSFTKRAVAVTNGDVTYAIEESDDLGLTDAWTSVTPTTDDDTTITYTLPAGSPKKFARLVIAAAP
jgi:autotransporter-associated beta strand protein